MNPTAQATIRIHAVRAGTGDTHCEFCGDGGTDMWFYQCREDAWFASDGFAIFAHPTCFVEFLRAEYADWNWETR